MLDEVLALVQEPLTFAVLAQSCSGLCWWRLVAVRILQLWDRDARGGPDSGGLVIGTQSWWDRGPDHHLGDLPRRVWIPG